MAIAVRGISMVFGSKAAPFQALNNVDLNIRKGELHLLMGPSGAGKTTLLLITAGLLTPTAGEVRLLGEEITRLSRHQLAEFRLQNVGFVFQDTTLLRALTAIENIELLLRLKGVQGQAVHRQAEQLLESVGLGDKANSLPRLLSGGQQQRVAVARALAGNPQLIIADEPTSALDSENGRIVDELFLSLVEQGCTVLMATHDSRTLKFADRVTLLEDGMITTNSAILTAI